MSYVFFHQPITDHAHPTLPVSVTITACTSKTHRPYRQPFEVHPTRFPALAGELEQATSFMRTEVGGWRHQTANVFLVLCLFVILCNYLTAALLLHFFDFSSNTHTHTHTMQRDLGSILTTCTGFRKLDVIDLYPISILLFKLSRLKCFNSCKFSWMGKMNSLTIHIVGLLVLKLI